MPIRFLDEPSTETPVETSVKPEDIRFGAQGLLAGYGEEAEALLKTGFGLLGDYEGERDALREQLRLAREKYPYRSTAAEIGGAVGGALFTPAAIPSLARALAPTTARGMAALGGAGGAVYGTGTSEREGLERLSDAPLSGITGAVGGVVGGLAVQKGAELFSKVIEGIRRSKGERASKVVEQEFQRIMQDSGMTFEEIIESARRGEVPADMSETARAYLGSLPQYIDDPTRARIRERAPQARSEAFGRTQEILVGDRDANVLKVISQEFENVKKNTSKAYDEVFEKAPKLKASARPSIQRALNDAPEALGELKKVMRGDLFTVGPKNLIKLNRVPTLREAELIRRAIANKAGSFYKADMPLAGEKYANIDLQLRSLLDDLSPELAQTRQVWSQIEKNAEQFKIGNSSLTKSAEEIEIAFEEALNKGEDAVSAFRSGLAAALNRKAGRKSLPAALSDMERKEAQIFEKVFPEDSYDEVMDLMDRATRTQLTANNLKGSPTKERQARESMMGMGGVVADAVEAKATGSPFAFSRLAGRLLRRVAKDLGSNMSEDQKREVVRLLVEENPDVLEKALKDKAGYAALLSAATGISNRLRGAATLGGVVTGEKAREAVFE